MDPDPRADLRPKLPRRFGRYEAFLRIGAGGMAQLFLGVQHGPFAVKKLVVIKQLRREHASDPRFVEMFVDEARIAMRLNHPNVVHTYDVLVDAPDYCLVMEYLDGHSLLEILQRVERRNMPLDEHLWVLTQLLAGLHYAHQLRDFDGDAFGIVHCDVSPSNVFVCHSGEVKLLDFGIARISSALGSSDRVLRGKVGYLSPEQCEGKPATARSDLYAVGVMLWEAMARRRRSPGQSQTARLQARVDGTETPIERVWPEAPAALVAIANRALRTEAEQRYATALEFQRDLERFLAETASHAGAQSLARLVQPLFAREKAALDRAIEVRLGSWEPSAVVASAPLRAPDAAARRDRSRAGDAEERTSRIDVDRTLLEATRSDVALARLRPGATLRRRLIGFRSRPLLWLALSAALGAAAAIGLASSARRTSLAGFPPNPSARGPAAAPSVRDAGPAGESIPTVEAVSPSPPLEAARAEPPTAASLSKPAPGSAVKPRPSRAAGASGRFAAPLHPRPAQDPGSIEPGVDLLSAPARKRTRVSLDEEDPYAP